MRPLKIWSYLLLNDNILDCLWLIDTVSFDHWLIQWTFKNVIQIVWYFKGILSYKLGPMFCLCTHLPSSACLHSPDWSFEHTRHTSASGILHLFFPLSENVSPAPYSQIVPYLSSDLSSNAGFLIHPFLIIPAPVFLFSFSFYILYTTDHH